jgi:hypothetical protein
MLLTAAMRDFPLFAQHRRRAHLYRDNPHCKVSQDPQHIGSRSMIVYVLMTQQSQERQSVRMDSAGEMAGAAPGMKSLGNYARKLALTQAKAGLLPLPTPKQQVSLVFQTLYVSFVRDPSSCTIKHATGGSGCHVDQAPGKPQQQCAAIYACTHILMR